MKYLALITLALFGLARASPTGLIREMERHRDQDFNGKQWVLLIAGSNTYDNYRHQADICHSFQVLKNHGVPEEQIVVMMYDDIANSDENPYPGTIINKPGGKDVYHGVPKDYIGDDVTPDNAIKILNGDKTLKAAGKKVIESTDQDHVFIYFADHGAPGLVAFPNDELDSDTLNKALNDLYAKKKYQKLVLYVEACESGSMFDGILSDKINIYATTAANPDESSYACYWDDDRQTYLGDVYSVNWIEDSDAQSSLAKETLEQQFTKVKAETNTSHCMEYGDKTIAKLDLSEFQGPKKAQFDSVRVPIVDAVKSSDVPLIRAFRSIPLAKDPQAQRNKAQQILASRIFLVGEMKKLAKAIGKAHGLDDNDLIMNKRRFTQHKCASQLYKAFDRNCFDISKHTYTMRHLYVLANVCEQVNVNQIPFVAQTIAEHCSASQAIHEHSHVIV